MGLGGVMWGLSGLGEVRGANEGWHFRTSSLRMSGQWMKLLVIKLGFLMDLLEIGQSQAALDLVDAKAPMFSAFTKRERHSHTCSWGLHSHFLQA